MWFHANGILDPLHTWVVVAVTTNIGDDDQPTGIIDFETAVKLRCRYSFNRRNYARPKVKDKPAYRVRRN